MKNPRWDVVAAGSGADPQFLHGGASHLSGADTLQVPGAHVVTGALAFLAAGAVDPGDDDADRRRDSQSVTLNVQWSTGLRLPRPGSRDV